MSKGAFTWLVLLLLASGGFAKDKNKSTLPAYVLQAHFVAVLIDPEAGISIDDPRANEKAQKDVEAALLKWGRFSPVLSTQAADLIIVVRKGHGRTVDETIPDARQNNRGGVITPGDAGVSMGGQRPSSPDMSGQPGTGQPGGLGSSQPRMEIGGADDSLAVYEGGVDDPLSSAPAWRYVRPDGLSPGSVPAVTAFRKAVEDAEKAAAKAAGKTP